MSTKSQRAVEVAEDVLKQLNKRKNGYLASGMGYLQTKYDLTSAEGSLQDHLDGIQEGGCEVCALGALLLSKARLYDDVPISNDGICITDCLNGLTTVFSQRQLNLIEAAYEGGRLDYDNSSLERSAVAFGEKYRDRKARMRAIMQNIVENQGKFVPPKLVSVKSKAAAVK